MRDILVRAVKTFFQGFLGSMTIMLPNADLSDEAVIRSIFIGAIASGISAVMNLVLNFLNKKKEGK